MMIAKEGRIFVIPLFFSEILFLWLWYKNIILFHLPVLIGLFFLFCVIFFRNPKRIIKEKRNQILSPADGKIIRIEKVDDDEIGEAKIISIFLNIFNVHVNRMPLKGSFEKIKYEKGKFLLAFQHNACDENERNSISIMTEIGPIRIIQIAGLLARRIICYAKKGESMDIGERLGFMRFGSRIDIILPGKVDIKVKNGQKVMGNITIIGTF